MTQEKEDKETNRNDVSYFHFNVIINTTKLKKVICSLMLKKILC